MGFELLKQQIFPFMVRRMSEGSSSNAWIGSVLPSVLSSDGGAGSPIVTPGLIGSVAAFLHNLFLLAPGTGSVLRKENLLALLQR